MPRSVQGHRWKKVSKQKEMNETNWDKENFYNVVIFEVQRSSKNVY